MASIKKYNGSSFENAAIRKMTTATAEIEPTIYTDGTAITSYTIKGNTVQNGTPTPSNPVDVNGVGVRTENLFDESTIQIGGLNYQTGAEVPDDSRRRSGFIAVNSDTYYSISRQLAQTSPSNFWILGYDENKNPITDGIFSSSPCTIVAMGGDVSTASFWCTQTTKYIRWYVTADNSYSNLMLNTGSTAKPYEPYGYKIPILTAQGTAVNYLGSVQSTRQIKKLVLTGNEGWTKAASATGVYYGNVLNNAYNQDLVLTTVCTHYIGQPNTSTVTLMEDMHCAVRSVQADTLYIRDTNIATREDWISYLQQQYANGTPVTVWYVLATATTGTVNEPLMKIGDYADTLSNAAQIPTTEGANTITVDTTVQPSEFTATWTGWHDSSVKEYDGTNWQ